MPSQTFNYTGSFQTWTVPVGVTSVLVDMAGGQGQGSTTTSGGTLAPGLGGRTQVVVPANPGDTWYVYVAGAASGITGGFNGGGNGVASIIVSKFVAPASGAGGGASDIRVNSQNLAARLVVAAGGGGAGSGQGHPATTGGIGGGGNGPAGDNGGTYGTSGGATGGGGGSDSGGAAGTGTVNGNPGTLGQGGAGVPVGSSSLIFPSGGGGGGFYGGGSGSANGNGGTGGGGGSCYGPAGVIYTDAFRSGNGYATLTWNTASSATPRRKLSGAVITVGYGGSLANQTNLLSGSAAARVNTNLGGTAS